MKLKINNKEVKYPPIFMKAYIETFGKSKIWKSNLSESDNKDGYYSNIKRKRRQQKEDLKRETKKARHLFKQFKYEQ